MYYPPEGDYQLASYGVFTYQLVLQNTNEDQMTALYNATAIPGGIITQVIKGSYGSLATIVNYNKIAVEEPVPFVLSAAASGSALGTLLAVALCTAVSVVMLF